MKNPLVLQREALHLSQRKLASLAHVSRSTVVNNERGYSASPSPNLLKVLFKNPSSHLYLAYDAFRSNHRRTTGAEFLDSSMVFVPYFVPESSSRHLIDLLLLTKWGESRSLDELCRSLCIDPFSLRSWRLNPHRVSGVPGLLLEALKEAGVSPRRLNFFMEYDAQYREGVRRGKTAGKVSVL